MKKVNPMDALGNSNTRHWPWGLVTGMAGVAFGLAVWFLQGPNPADDPNWVALAEVEELQAQLTQQENLLKQLQQRYQEETSRVGALQSQVTALVSRLEQAIVVDQLPVALQATEADEALSKIDQLCAQSQNSSPESVMALLGILAHIQNNGVINTNLAADNPDKVQLYQHIQQVLKTLGMYTGPITGEQVSTAQSLKDFQKAQQLEVDGKMGMKTFEALAQRFQTTLQTEPQTTPPGEPS
ncbi:peptidoglycan-binding protein [Planctomycetota bacterium]